MGAEHTGPRIHDRVQVGGTVVGLATVGGVPGAMVDPGARLAPIWLPLSVLVVTRRGGDR